MSSCGNGDNNPTHWVAPRIKWETSMETTQLNILDSPARSVAGTPSVVKVAMPIRPLKRTTYEVENLIFQRTKEIEKIWCEIAGRA